eukprot:gb/GECG01012590.1/.p1 GENE.gb/GECG01012590.1/~~gb/GECG01012590.1/.p1  ORF type:complete len:726 (+),score=84.48 gb/GECG01012590.1/:1-2178(+)
MASCEDMDGVELEHVIGFNAHMKNSIALHPTEKGKYITGSGSAVVYTDIEDPHAQKFFGRAMESGLMPTEDGAIHDPSMRKMAEGPLFNSSVNPTSVPEDIRHDNHVTCVAVAPEGQIAATGQLPSPYSSEAESPVIVWNCDDLQAGLLLTGPKHGIRSLAFSPDGAFLACASNEHVLYIWDMQTGEQLFCKIHVDTIGTLCWGGIDMSSRRPSYRIHWTVGSHISMGTLIFDMRTLKYVMKETAAQLPSSGFNRHYAASVTVSEEAGNAMCRNIAGLQMASTDHSHEQYSPSMTHPSHVEFLLLGTEAGEVTIFSVGSKVFRAAFPISTNGITALAATADGTVLCGCGDGNVKVLVGADKQWKCVAETQVVGGVNSVTCFGGPSLEEFLCSTSAGRLYYALFELPYDEPEPISLSKREIDCSHTGVVTSCSFGLTQADVVATGSIDGRVRLWDLNNYTIIQSSRGPPETVALDVHIDDYGEGDVLSSWDDGKIRCYRRGQGEQVWCIGAHKGKATCITSTTPAYISAGDDGRILVWKRGSKELVLQFEAHHGPVRELRIDTKTPYIVHSIGNDRCVFSHDMEKECRVTSHQLPRQQAASFTAITQKRTGERELITSSSDGRILGWDYDVPSTPVFEMRSGLKTSINCVSVSPSGQFLAAAGNNGALVLFRIKDGHSSGGQLVASILGHSGKILTLAWSPDEKQIITGGADNCISVYNVFSAKEE